MERFTTGAEADAQLIAALEKNIHDLRVELQDWKRLALELERRLEASTTTKVVSETAHTPFGPIDTNEGTIGMRD